MEEPGSGYNKPEKPTPVDTVMVVDDEENWCFVIKRILQRTEVGNQIITTKNGQDALEKLQAIATTGGQMPALIFLDLKMPVMDGFEFLEQATKSAELNLSQTRIYILTSSFLPKDKERAHAYPISGFISKPLTKEILADILS